jgi:hypothetical protein
MGDASQHIEHGIEILSYLDPSVAREIAFGLRQQRIVLGDPAATDRPILLVTHFPPHAVIPRHHHREVFADVVVQGSSNIDGEWFGAGTIRWFPAGAVYGPVEAGPDGCTLLEIYVDQPGMEVTFDEATLTDEQRAQIGRRTSDRS